MMGQPGPAQEQLLYAFSLESHVPADHLLRRIDSVLDLSDLRQHLAPYYSHTGRHSIDPELMIRTPIVGYCFGIRSEWRLCEEVHLNLAYRLSLSARHGVERRPGMRWNHRPTSVDSARFRTRSANAFCRGWISQAVCWIEGSDGRLHVLANASDEAEDDE